MTELQVILHLTPDQLVDWDRLVDFVPLECLLEHLEVGNVLILVSGIEFELHERNIQVDRIDDLSISCTGTELFDLSIVEGKEGVDPVDQLCT